MIEELNQLGVGNHVACRKGSAFHQYCQQHQIPHTAPPFANEFDLVTALQVKAYCKKHSVDLMHVHSGHAHAISVWSGILGNKAPIILSRRVDFPVKANALSRLKYNYSGIKRVICVSDKIKEVVSESLERPELCVTVHSGIDLNRFPVKSKAGMLHREFNIPQHYTLIGNVSAIAPHKDYCTFVDTAAQIAAQRPETAFFIVGDGPLRQDIEVYVSQKGLQKQVYFTGFRKDIPKLMPELDLMLITSETEGLGTTVLDAFACHTPVVATAAGGIPEMVIDGETGMLAPIKSPEALAAKCLQVLQQPELREKLVRNAALKVQEFSKEQTARKTLEVYKEVLFS